MARRGRDWTEPELVRVLSLYHQLPFGKLNQRNRSVRQLAEIIDRSPSSIALKLVNFASLDPTLRARGIRGMPNASRLDKEMWNRYEGRWAELAHALPEDVSDDIDPLPERVRVTTAQETRIVRRGQQFFRNAVLAAYVHKCCVTGMSVPSLLRASHIVPWAASIDSRLNPANGLCLNALFDAAFDSGLLTIDDDFQLVASPRLAARVQPKTHKRFFASFVGKRIFLPERNQPSQTFLRYHREHVYLS